MKFVPTDLPGVVVVEPRAFHDARGFFAEVYHREKFVAAGIADEFVQDNHTLSQKDVLRGLHAQVRHPQAKLVRVVRGAVYDVAVDIRRGSPTFKRWTATELSAANRLQLYVPAGFAHGFCVVDGPAEVLYRCSRLYDPADEVAIRWNDPDLGIAWPVAAPVLSERDRSATPLASQLERLPVFGA